MLAAKCFKPITEEQFGLSHRIKRVPKTFNTTSEAVTNIEGESS